MNEFPADLNGSPVDDGFLSRRRMLQLSGLGLGNLAMNWLTSRAAPAAQASAGHPAPIDLTAKTPDLPPRAKSVILLMQNGGPSQMDLFDPKPELQKNAGKQHSIKVEMFQKGSEQNRLLASPFRFQKHGQSGIEMSEAVPYISRVVDDLCVVRSMHTGHNNHTESLVMFMTGQLFQGKPTFGSWITYALGSENQNLPAYVVLRDPKGYNTSGTLTWTSGWLPSLYRGTEFSTEGPPVLNLTSARKQRADVQKANLEFLDAFNRIQQRYYPQSSDLETRIRNYELAARMQLSAAEVLDTSNESASVEKLYGLDNQTTRPYGLRCLLARKLVEAGVRFIQIHPEPFQPWDSHAKVKSSLENICGKTDLPTAGLITDLAQRGLLDETIVLWSGEFGRLPVSQNGSGRDHNRNAFTLLAAGGGFKSGYVHGETDEVGYKAAVDPVSVSDLHATLLHLLGIDHETLTYDHSGREETLTDPSLTGARVVHALMRS